VVFTLETGRGRKKGEQTNKVGAVTGLEAAKNRRTETGSYKERPKNSTKRLHGCAHRLLETDGWGEEKGFLSQEAKKEQPSEVSAQFGDPKKPTGASFRENWNATP